MPNAITPERIEHLFGLLRKAPVNATKRYPNRTLEEAIVDAASRDDNNRLGKKTLENYFNNIVAIFNFAVERRFMLDARDDLQSFLRRSRPRLCQFCKPPKKSS